jgi:hypothetical protein
MQEVREYVQGMECHKSVKSLYKDNRKDRHQAMLWKHSQRSLGIADLIAEHVQPTALNVEVVIDAEKRAKNIEHLKNRMEEKKAKAVEKAAELRKLTQL